MPWVTVDDVRARYEGVLPAEREPWVETLITDAESAIRDEISDIDTRVSDGRVSRESMTRVVCAMVLGVVRNPTGYTSQSAGEFSYSFAGNPATAGGSNLRLSRADKRALIGPPRAATLPARDTALDTLFRPVWRN